VRGAAERGNRRNGHGNHKSTVKDPHRAGASVWQWQELPGLETAVATPRCKQARTQTHTHGTSSLLVSVVRSLFLLFVCGAFRAAAASALRLAVASCSSSAFVRTCREYVVIRREVAQVRSQTEL